ncbi:stage VI sporulation protein D [Oceanobacillus massiliensis]|uniref:stage VI sporulation protein D n=1 Tax=Oceanobacillus massiliensis TaxID=1465765 RepID=UPI00028A1DB9|nr:stage VI sporulation protein D [Oceanobacillus massiliensis]
MTGDSKAFTFELQESLYFEKGQEVAEMRGIALEPEISIHPYDEYISIRGIIELHGEYEKIISAEIVEEPLDFEDFQAKRFVGKVTEEDGLALFSHQFPVEISVPPYRVADLNEVTVSIESFDYELPEPGQLKLFASVEIHGINSEAEPLRDEFEEQNEAADEPGKAIEEIENEEEGTFEFEIRKPMDVGKDDMDVSANKVVPPEVIASEERGISIEKEDGEKEDREREADPDRWKVKSESLADFFNQMPKEGAVTEPEVGAADEQSEADDAAEEIENENEQQPVADATYLSDIFRNTQEERYTKMRLCIVQEQDTIETIAQRFSISPLQLIKQNELGDDFEVHEGQLLYIPVNK